MKSKNGVKIALFSTCRERNRARARETLARYEWSGNAFGYGSIGIAITVNANITNSIILSHTHTHTQIVIDGDSRGKWERMQSMPFASPPIPIKLLYLGVINSGRTININMWLAQNGENNARAVPAHTFPFAIGAKLYRFESSMDRFEIPNKLA